MEHLDKVYATGREGAIGRACSACRTASNRGTLRQVTLPARVGFDWRRLSRWCMIAALGLVLWLLVPVAKCSYAEFRDTPLGEVDPEGTGQPGQGDKERVKKGAGFFGHMSDAIGECYAATPLLGQEAWKRELMFALLGVGALAGLIGWQQGRSKKTFAD